MVALVAAGVTAAVVPSVTHLTEFVTQERADRRLAQARKLHDPDGLTPVALRQGHCVGDALVRCATTADPRVDALAAETRRSLSRITGQEATLRCSTLTLGVAVRSCDVQAYSGRITVSITNRTKRTGRTVVVTGADYLVQAS
jgi:hypothetical protein